jgi:hypothetical protein
MRDALKELPLLRFRQVDPSEHNTFAAKERLSGLSRANAAAGNRQPEHCDVLAAAEARLTK